MKRRTLLKVGFGGGLLLALGGVGLSLRGPTRNRPVPDDLRVLSDRQYLTLAAVAARVALPPAGTPDADTIGVAQKLDLLFATMHPGDVKDIQQLLDLLDNALGGLLLGGRTQTFTGSDPEQQDQILQEWRTSGLTVRRSGYKVLAGLCAATYHADPRTYAGVGYPGPPSYGNVRPATETP